MDTGYLVDGTQGTRSALKDTYEYKWLIHFQAAALFVFVPTTVHSMNQGRLPFSFNTGLVHSDECMRGMLVDQSEKQGSWKALNSSIELTLRQQINIFPSL